MVPAGYPNHEQSPIADWPRGVAFGGATPFTAEVYFVSLREFSDLRWGTAQPVAFRDTDFGMVRLRAFGGYSMRVGDPQLFVQQVVGSQGVYTTGFIEDYLRGVIVNEFNDMLGAVHTTLLDLPRQSSELAAAMRNALVDDFRESGSISPVSKSSRLRRRMMCSAALTSERACRSLGTPETPRSQTKPGHSLVTPTHRQSRRRKEAWSSATGLGVGEAMAPVTRETVAEPARLGRAGTMECPHCHAQAPVDARFCPTCGRPLQSQAGQ